jgi:phage repressor protein C with HTH and peptisase S24 domain
MAKAYIINELLEKLNIKMYAFEQKIGVGNTTLSQAVKRNADLSHKMIDKIVAAYPEGIREHRGIVVSDATIAGYIGGGIEQVNITGWQNRSTPQPRQKEHRDAIRRYFGFADMEAITKTELSRAIEAYPKPANGFSDTSTHQEDKEGQQSVSKQRRKIPVIGEAAAGTTEEIIVTETRYDAEYIDVGDLLKDSQAAFIVYGNSMTPAYPPGCVVGIRLNRDNFIQPGETYLLVTKSNRVFKRLYYNEDNTGYLCVSDNTLKHEHGPLSGKYFYPAFEIAGDDVLQVYDITGMIKRNRHSNIMQRQI